MRVFLLLTSYIFLSACSSLVNVDYDKSVNFSQLKTFSIVEKPIRIPQDTRIDSPFMVKRVNESIKTSLAAKGFIFSTDAADFKVKYFLDLEKEVETNESGVSIGLGTSSRRSAIGFGFNIPVGDVNTIDKLKLTIDIVSTKTKQLLWRGSFDYQLYDGSTPEKNTALIQHLVKEIVNDFPPK